MSTELTTLAQAQDFTAVVDMAVNAMDSIHTQRAYRRALTNFMSWYAEHGRGAFTRAAVNAYKQHLKDTGAGGLNQRLSAIRKLAKEAEANGLIDANTARGIVDVEGIQQRGTRAGNWLTKDEAEQLINAPDDTTLKCKRDRALLAVLVGAGLRREECVNLKASHVQQRDGRWVIVDITGKRNKLRTVPIASWVQVLIERWKQAAGITAGYLFPELTRWRGVGREQTSTQAIMRAVVLYAEEIGKPNIRPHDLRRTYAKLARKGGAQLEQIKFTLGHDSVATTEKYVGDELDYQNAPADAMGLSVRLRA